MTTSGCQGQMFDPHVAACRGVFAGGDAEVGLSGRQGRARGPGCVA